MRQGFTSFFMYLVREFYLEIYYGKMVSSSLWISVDQQMYSRRNEAFGKIHKFCCVRANSARMLLHSALRHGHVSIGQKHSEQVQIMMKSIIDGSRC
jgi:hypothetical protein